MANPSALASTANEPTYKLSSGSGTPSPCWYNSKSICPGCPPRKSFAARNSFDPCAGSSVPLVTNGSSSFLASPDATSTTFTAIVCVAGIPAALAWLRNIVNSEDASATGVPNESYTVIRNLLSPLFETGTSMLRSVSMSPNPRSNWSKMGLHSPILSTRLVQYLAAIWHILSPPLTEPVHSDPWLCDDWLWTSTRPSGSGFLEMPCTYRICLWSIILAPPSSRDIWIHPLSIIEGANPAHVAHAHIAHARARHRRARGSAIIRLDDRAPDPGQTIPADHISLLAIIHNHAFGMSAAIQ